jgi:hypothetical protein
VTSCQQMSGGGGKPSTANGGVRRILRSGARLSGIMLNGTANASVSATSSITVSGGRPTPALETVTIKPTVRKSWPGIVSDTPTIPSTPRRSGLRLAPTPLVRNPSAERGCGAWQRSTACPWMNTSPGSMLNAGCARRVAGSRMDWASSSIMTTTTGMCAGCCARNAIPRWASSTTRRPKSGHSLDTCARTSAGRPTRRAGDMP